MIPWLAPILLSAATSQAGLESAPPVEREEVFTIKSIEESFDSLPYPTRRKTTTLTWNTPTPMLSYVLEDDGERMQANARVGPEKNWNCLVSSRLLAFDVKADVKASSLFGPDLLLTAACTKALPKGRIRELRRMIDIARRDFPAAYADFVQATKLQHGPSERRCKEYRQGHHGLICERFSDEKK